MRERKNGSFQFTVSKGLDADGKQIRDYVEFRGTRTEAKKELTRLQSEMDRGMYVTPAHYTLAGYLDEWLRVYCQSNLAPRTYERYESLIQRHIIPALGSTRLQDLSPLQVERYYGHALAEGRLDGAGGLSAPTVLYIHHVLHSALDWAQRKNLVVRNVADNVDPPRTVRPETHALDEDQTAAVLALLDGSDLYLPALVSVSTGVRRGELLALCWSDVDLERLSLTVCRSLQETKAGLIFKEPKNGRTRTVGIPPELARELRAHRRAQAAHRLALGIAYQDQGLIFGGVDGKPMNPRVLSRKFDRFRTRHVKAARKIQEQLEANGMGNGPEHAAAVASERLVAFRWHDWRHSYASQQLRAGEQVLVVSKALGHATTAFTMDVYGHVLPGEQNAAATRHGERLAAARERLQAAGASK